MYLKTSNFTLKVSKGEVALLLGGLMWLVMRITNLFQ